MRGIGLEAARYLLNNHANVVVCARSQEPLEKLRIEHSNQVQVLAGDLKDSSLAQKAVDVAVKYFGGLNGVIVNHGAMLPVQKLADCSLQDWNTSLNINFLSAVAFVGRNIAASIESD